MLNLSQVTDKEVVEYLDMCLRSSVEGSDRWRLLGAVRELSVFHSFSGTRTYPRPDHPDPRKRLPLEYLLAAILISLRTTLENEQRAVAALVVQYPDVEALQGATVEEIAGCITMAGMPLQKATRIRACLNQIAKLDGGLENLATWSLADARGYLLSLPGFGPKAADCLLTIGLGHASMVVDVNVFRMSTVLFDLIWPKPASFADATQVADVKARLDKAVGNDVFLCQIVHTLLLLEGRYTKVHVVGRCRIMKFCLSCASSSSDLLFV